MKKISLIFMSIVLALLIGTNTVWAQDAYYALSKNNCPLTPGMSSAKEQILKYVDGVTTVTNEISKSGSTSFSTIYYNSTSFAESEFTDLKNYSSSSTTQRTMQAYKLSTTSDLVIDLKDKTMAKGWVIYASASNDPCSHTIFGEDVVTQNASKVPAIKEFSNLSGELTIHTNGTTKNGTSKDFYVIVFFKEAGRTVVSTTTAITGVTINGEAISATDLATLSDTKALTLSEAYTIAPTVVFSTTTTTTYDSGDPDVETDTVEANVAEGAGNTYVATATVGEDEYTITVNKNLEAAIEVTPAAVTLTSAKAGTASATITVAAANLTGDALTITLPGVAGLTCDKTSLPIENGSVNAEITLSYQSNDDVAEAEANVVLAAGATTASIAVTYSSTAAVTTLVPVDEATTWNWSNAVVDPSKDISPEVQNAMVYFANYEGWAESFDAAALRGNAQQMYKSANKCYQGSSLYFEAACCGKLTVEYSNTNVANKNGIRLLFVNGEKANDATYVVDKNTTYTAEVMVNAGEVHLQGMQVIDKDGNDVDNPSSAVLRIYSMTFTPQHNVAVGAAGFCSFAPSFDVEIPEGVQAWALESKTDIEENVMNLTEVTGSIQAGKGVILTADEGEYVFAPATGASTSSLLCGAGAEGVDLEEGEAYILGVKEGAPCFYLTGAGKLGAYKAYLPKSTLKAPVFRINFGHSTDGIDSVAADADAQGASYNVLGQKVGENHKGIVIKNGTKMIVK